MTTGKVDIPIYGNLLHIVIIGDFIKDLHEFNKKYRSTLTAEDEVLGFMEQRGNHILVVINVGKHRRIYPKEPKREVEIIATICHESVHACNVLFRDKGIELDLNNDEPQAYLTDWIMKEVYKTYLKFRKNESIIQHRK